MKRGLMTGIKRLVAAKTVASTNYLTRFVIVFAAMMFFAATALATGPALTVPGSVSVGENGTTNVSIGVTDAAEPIFTVITSATSSNTNLISNSSLTFSGSGTNRLLSIRPTLNKAGSATITVVATDSQPAGVTNTFSVTVTFTNYFVKPIADQSINENAKATNFSFTVGDVEYAVSNVVITVTSSNTSLVPATNLVLSGTGTNRTLKVTPATNQNGLTLIEMVASDGHNSPATNDFLLDVLAVNQAPSFTMATNKLFYVENYGPVSNANFVTNISSGPASQASQSNYFVLNYTNNFYSSAPAIDTNGNLTFQVGTNVFGTNTIQVILYNTGPTTNGGKNAVTNNLTVGVAFVNQRPTFNLTTNFVQATEEGGSYTNVGFITNITAGATNEIHQTLTFKTIVPTNNATNALFTKLPTISASGNLTFTLAAHSFGTNTVTVSLTDNGGTNNGGINSLTTNFVIGVAQTNHAPVIYGTTNLTFLENATNGLSKTVGVWDYDPQASNIVLTATSSSNAVVGVSVTGTNIVSPTNVSFTVTLAPTTNASGKATITLVATEGSLSTTNTYTVTVTLVNHAPSFTPATNLLLVAEESGAVTNVGFLTNLSAGPSNEISQSWTFKTTTSTNSPTNALFTALPTVATNGTLTFKPAAHSFGTNTVTVVMTDNGGTNNGGVNVYTNTFQIGIVATNHAPVIYGYTNITILENGSSNRTIGVWDYDAQSTNFVLTATSSTNLVTAQVVGTNVVNGTNATFTVSVTPRTNDSGTASVTLVATEGSLSTTNTFNVIVTLVNHAPSFSLETNLLVTTEEIGAVTNVGFLTNLSAGPSNEISQKWTFAASTTTNSSTNVIFAKMPAFATNGTLTFTPATHSFGTNTITVTMTDNGGTNNGGVNVYSNTFQIAVVPTNHAPNIYNATNVTLLENSTNGLNRTIGVWDYDFQSTNLVLTATSSTNLVGVSITATNVASSTNALFTVALAPRTNDGGPAVITLVAAEGALSITNVFKVTVTPVNQAPTFTPATNLFLVEEETPGVTNVGFLGSLSAGPANEASQKWTFTATTVSNNATNVIFTSAPSFNTNGDLTFKLAAHSYGTNLVTVVMTDTGGTANGGVNAYTNTFLIGVVATNHAPVIYGATNQTFLENATNGTATVGLWDYDAASTSNLVLTATSGNTNVLNVSVTSTNNPSTTNATFGLTYSLVTNNSGVATITLVGTKGSLSSTNTYTVSVTLVNQAPTNYPATNLLLVAEESGTITNAHFLGSLSAGPTNENGQTWTFAASTTTNSATNVIFTQLPTIATNGTLTFAAAAHSYGTNTITVVMTDNGGTANGGVNAYTNSFEIGVVATNHAPVIYGLTNQTVLENATNGLTATVGLWDYDAASTSNLVLTATSGNTNLLTVAVTSTNNPSATNATFGLTYTLVTNNSGTATITLVGTEGSLSSTNSYTVTVTLVNHAPTNYPSTNFLLVAEESGPLTNASFLGSLHAGPTNEIAQGWSFATSGTTNSPTNVIFAQFPAIDTNGNLTFAAAAHSYGTNTITVVMTDDGGTANGGVNSYTNSFQIGVAATNHAPVIYGFTNQTVLENGTNGLSATIGLWDYDATSTSNLVLTATSGNTNLLTVTLTSTNNPSTTNATFGLTYTLLTNNSGTATITLVGTEGSLSSTNSYTVTVTLVNHAPTNNPSTNLLLVAEESGAITNTNFLGSLSAGPSNEIAQTWTFKCTTVTNNSTNVIFTQLPAIDTNGNLSFAAAAHSYGTNLVTVVMTDSGGTNNGGVNSFTNSFTIGVVATNHAPVIYGATNQTFLENANSGLTTTVGLWDYDAGSTSNLVLTATSDNTNLVNVSITSTNNPSTTNATFGVAYALSTNASGTATITFVGTEGSLSSTNTATITVTLVNHAPHFTPATNEVAFPENNGATVTNSFLGSLSAGPANEIAQSWTFTVTTPTNNATNALFSQLPVIDTNGNLTFTTASNSFGTNIVTVVMKDNGGTNNGGVNAYTNTFQLDITQVQYPQIFIGIPTNKTILENQSTNLTVAFSIYDPLTNACTVTCVSSNTNVVTVSVGGSNNTNRTVILAPVTNQNGVVTIVVTAANNSITNSTNFTLTITPVNQAPSFSLAVSNITVDMYDTAVTYSNALTNILAGPTNESSQTVNFTVTNSNPSLFSVPPSVDSSGTLSFTPKTQGGTVRVGIKAVDDGGTANGGVNTSAVQTLTITIPANAFQYLAGPFAGLFYDTNTAANESSGYFNLTLQSNGTFAGYILNAGDSNTFSGQFDISNSFASVTASNYNLNLTVDTTANWTESVSGSVSNTTANWNAELSSYLIGFSTQFPTSLAGDYLIALPGFANPAAGPSGDGTFSLLINANGTASLSGYTADNTYGSQTSQISVNGYYPLYIPLYNGGAGGSLVGWLYFSGALSNAVTPSSSVTWFDEAGSTTLYSGGFTNQSTPLAALYDSTLSDLLSFSSGTVILSGGNLSTAITNTVTISANAITVNPSATNGLSLSINRSTGEITGSFTAGGQTNSIYSTIIQNSTNVAKGYFIGTSQGGKFILYGN